MRSLDEIAKINETTEREAKQRVACHSITTKLALALQDLLDYDSEDIPSLYDNARVALENWRKAKEGTL